MLDDLGVFLISFATSLIFLSPILLLQVLAPGILLLFKKVSGLNGVTDTKKPIDTCSNGQLPAAGYLKRNKNLLIFFDGVRRKLYVEACNQLIVLRFVVVTLVDSDIELVEVEGQYKVLLRDRKLLSRFDYFLHYEKLLSVLVVNHTLYSYI